VFGAGPGDLSKQASQWPWCQKDLVLVLPPPVLSFVTLSQTFLSVIFVDTVLLPQSSQGLYSVH
jgi:hypothetical protein